MRALLLLLMVPMLAHAASGLPDAVTPDGGRYYGSLRNGKLQGLGRIEWDSGALYEGAFNNGLYQGRGKLTTADGRSYSGDFANGQFDGRGRFEAPTGEVYEGDFDKGEFTGRGTYSRPDGARYRGEFRKWRMHGEGRYVDANGDIYEGRFVDGLLEGEGKVIYARPRGGRTGASGVWRNGRLVDDPDARQTALDVESALLSQRRLLDQALSSLAPGRRGVIDLYLLAVGGDGTQEVFRREVDFVRTQFDERFGTRSRSVALVNSRNTMASAPMATVTSIGEALKAIAARMDRDEDILFLFITSHGSREHELSLQQSSMKLRNLPARELGHLLKESGIRWKVVRLGVLLRRLHRAPARRFHAHHHRVAARPQLVRLRRRERLHLLRPRLLQGSATREPLVPGRVLQGRRPRLRMGAQGPARAGALAPADLHHARHQRPAAALVGGEAVINGVRSTFPDLTCRNQRFFGARVNWHMETVRCLGSRA